MINRISIIAAVCFAALMVLPAFSFAQEGEGDSGDTSAAGDAAATAPEPASDVEEPVVEESVVEEPVVEEPAADESAPAPEDTASSDASSSGAYSSAVEPTVAQSAVSDRKGRHQMRAVTARKSKKAGKSGKSCSASSAARGPLAQASAPPAAGCTRMNGNNGVLIAPDGTTLTITETSQGVIDVTVSNAPGGAYSGTLFVKGGPEAQGPGNPCVFNAVPNGATQTCTANINPNNGKLYGVSHVDACPPGVTPPGTPGTTPGTTPGGGRGGAQREQKRKKAAAKREVDGSAPVAATAVAAPGGQLPVTGLPVVWLVLLGGGLIASGLKLRRLT